MKTQIELGLEGAFKVDLYSGDQFVSTTDWFNNFITNTGLVYPYTYPFADCFRFLSIGTDGRVNDGHSTTGLYSFINTFNTKGTIVGTQSGMYIGWRGYHINPTDPPNSACTTILDNKGPRFFRAWTIPTGADGTVANGDINIQEFMVSPSSGSDPTGRYAFSRINRPLTIPDGYRAIISYQLAINVKNTGLSPFYSGTFATGNADTDNDYNILALWSSLSGYYRQVWHGLNCIDGDGIGYITKYGNAMEPSLNGTDLANYVCYLSSDNGWFDVSRTGQWQANVTQAYQADGLMGYIGAGVLLDPDDQNPLKTVDQLSDTDYYGGDQLRTWIPNGNYITPRNIRIGSNGADLPSWPSLGNYSVAITDLPSNFWYGNGGINATGYDVTYANPGAAGYPAVGPSVAQKAVFSTMMFRRPVDLSTQFSRTRKVTRQALFTPSAGGSTNTQFGSLVLAYKTTDSPAVYWPTMDAMFYDSSGNFLAQHYRFIDNIYLTQRGSGVADGYLVISGKNTNNVSRLSGRRTFQGPYSGPNGYDATHPCLTNTWGGTFGTETGGFLSSGAYPSTIVGDVNQVMNGGSGYGMVYGVVSDTTQFWEGGLDQGVLPHLVTNLNAPAQTGQLYWPYSLAGNEMIVKFTGVAFSGQNEGFFYDSGEYFTNGQQIVNSVTFTPASGGCSGVITLNGAFINDPTVFTSVPQSTSEYGYYLTTGRFNQQQLSSTYNTAFITSAATYTAKSQLDTDRTGNCTYCPPPHANPTFYITGTLQTANNNLSAGTFSVTNATRVTGLFSSIIDRGYGFYPNGVALSPTNVPEFAISGVSGSNPLYLTYVYLSGGTTLCAHSYLSPTCNLTTFARPTGYLNHSEISGYDPNDNTKRYGWRRLPNYALATTDGTQNSYSPTIGGAYPSWSLDNGMEIYFDITWSGTCPNGVTNCP